MSVDLERYAELYGKFGDGDIQRLLQHAAKLSRRRGRPDTVYVENTIDFTHKGEQLVQEIEQRQQLRKNLVRFFKREAPVGTDRTLGELAEPYYQRIGSSLQHEVPLGDLLLPAKIRVTSDRRDRELLEESNDIAFNIRTFYNRIVQSCMKAGLTNVGEVRNATNIGVGEQFVMRPITPFAAKFMRVAL